ncbi:hypothetical protein D3C84_912520 [compost metagenome]
MLDRNFNWSLALTLEPQGTGRREQVEHGSGQRAAAYAKCGNQHERSEQGPGDGPGGVGGIELAAGLAQVLRVIGQ